MNQPVTVGEIGEHGLIKEIITAAPSAANGDDAAVLQPASPNSRTVITTDMLIEGQHFTADYSTMEEVGIKAITANFADIEAMGARPVAAVLALAVPPTESVETIRQLARGIDHQVKRYSAELVGGDVTKGKQLVVTITAVGQLGGSYPPLTLDGARPGQRVVAHGKIGYSAAGLDLLQRFGRKAVPEEFSSLISAHCAPTLTPYRGLIARSTGATSMTDNSDGLIVDTGMIAKRSGVVIDFHGEAIAPDHLLCAAGKVLDTDPWTWVLTGGEDHTLIATTANNVPSGFREIGTVTRDGGGGSVTIDGTSPQYNEGWVSF